MSKLVSNTKHKKHYAQRGGGCGSYHATIPVAAVVAPAAAPPVVPKKSLLSAIGHSMRSVSTRIASMTPPANRLIPRPALAAAVRESVVGGSIIVSKKNSINHTSNILKGVSSRKKRLSAQRDITRTCNKRNHKSRKTYNTHTTRKTYNAQKTLKTYNAKKHLKKRKTYNAKKHANNT